MKSYFFPFKQVKENSNIVLYGAGSVGKAYYQQLLLTDYVKIVIWVDKKPLSKSVVSPIELLKLDDSDFDFVLIAVELKELADDIFYELSELGVKKEKIIHVKPILCSISEISGVQSALSLNDFLSCRTEVIHAALDDYAVYSYGDIGFFSQLKNEIIEHAGSNNVNRINICREVVDTIIRLDLSPRYAIVLLRLLYEARCFFSEALRLFVKNVGLLDYKTSQQYWTFIDIWPIWFYNPEVLYEDFFSELHELGGSIATSWNLEWTPLQYSYYNNNRICLVTLGLNEKTAVPEFFSPIVTEFIRRGYEFHILDIEYSLYDGGASFLKPILMSYSGNLSVNNTISKYFPDNVVFHYANVRDVIERQKKILSIISEINPFCILDASIQVGIISYYIYKRYPVVNIPLLKQGFSSSFFHKIIINDSDVTTHPPIEPEQVIRLFPPFKRKQPERLVTRHDYGLSEDDIICVTVSLRLAIDLSARLFNNMCGVISENRKIKWLLVGAETLPFLAKQGSSVVGDCIQFIKWESDLTGLYQICDIYVNPSRVGGGTTIAWAALAGLAIVTPEDAAAGHTIVGARLCVENEAKVALKVAELAADPVLLAKEKEIMREHASEWGVERYIDRLEAEMLHLAKDYSDGEYNSGI